jgi:hypothetical protein
MLDARREAVEVGEACALLRTDLAHANALYRTDCAIFVPDVFCQTEPALVFRRLAEYRLRLDIASDGSGELRAEQTGALSRIPFLVSYGAGLGLAFARLLIMVLTTAVVFVRGTQNASSSRHMMKHVFDTIRCRHRGPSGPNDFKWAMGYQKYDAAVDAIITAVALGSRILVLTFVWNLLVADDHARVIAFELAGITASLLHFLMRYGVLRIDLAQEAPLTKLGGPMSIVDVSAAVLLAFCDPPLLSSDEGRFAAVGRLLITILISVKVINRCTYATSMCAVLSVAVDNDRDAYRRDMYGYRTVLIVAGVLWTIQGAAAAASVAALFVGPAAYTMSRILLGSPTTLRFTLYFGVISIGLPTLTKVGLRALESECSVKKEV